MGRIWLDVTAAFDSAPLRRQQVDQLQQLLHWGRRKAFDVRYCASDAEGGLHEIAAERLQYALERARGRATDSWVEHAAGWTRRWLGSQPRRTELPGGLEAAALERLDVFASSRTGWTPGELRALGQLAAEAGSECVLLPAEAERARGLGLSVLPAREAKLLAVLRDAACRSYRGAAPFEDRLQNLYERLLRPGDHCIDIGAHTGRHCIPLACAVGPRGSVNAFEPIPAIRARLAARLEALDLANVTVRDAALSDESGIAGFVVAVDLPEESGLRERSVYNGPTRTERIDVPLARLDDLPLPPPRFVKLDTEGAEFKVLRGARHTIETARPVVAFEFGEASYAAYEVDPAQVFEYFSSLGYQMFSILGEPLGAAGFVEASHVQRYWDYVACPQQESAAVEAALRSYTPR